MYQSFIRDSLYLRDILIVELVHFCRCICDLDKRDDFSPSDYRCVCLQERFQSTQIDARAKKSLPIISDSPSASPQEGGLMLPDVPLRPCDGVHAAEQLPHQGRPQALPRPGPPAHSLCRHSKLRRRFCFWSDFFSHSNCYFGFKFLISLSNFF